MQTKSTANIYINGIAADATLKSLRAEASKLRNELSNLSPESDKFAAKAAQFKQVQGRIEEVNGSLRQTKGVFGQIQAEIGKFGTLALAYLGFDAITGKLGNMISQNAKLSDSFADVQKTTGLTEQEVKKLSSELKNYDTRTARSELLALARDAGKLGITGKRDIEEFVKAADKISVALGEDLGADAIKQIGKLVNVFQLKEEFGLEQSMIKVASAINDLGMSSEASEGFLVNFLNRMGGIAPLANISIDQTLALGATLDALGQTAEVSSTALSKMFVKMASEADKYAKIAGVSTDEFKKKMDENALEAFIMVLEAAGKTEGGIIQLTETLGDLGIEGGRATGVFGALAKNTDMLKKQMDIANKGFKEGTSVIDEFNVKNENLAAKVEKLQKYFAGLFINSSFLEGLKAMVDFGVRLVATPLSQKMEQERIELRKLELQLLNTNLPQADRVALIKELQDQYPEYFGSLDAERVSNDELRKSLKSLNDEMINKIILQKEDENIQRNNEKTAQKRLTFIEREDKLRAQIIKTAEKNNVQLKDGLNDVQQALNVLKEVESSGSPALDLASGRQQLAIAYGNYAKALTALNQQEERGTVLLEARDELMKRLGIQDSDKKVFRNISAGADAETSAAAPGIPNEKAQDDAYKNALDKLNQYFATEKAIIKTNMAADLENRGTYEAQLLEVETRQLNMRKELLEKFKKDTSDIELQIADNRIKLAEDEVKREAEAKKMAFEAIQNALIEEENLINENFANRIINQQQHELQLQELKIGGLEIMKAAHEAYGDEVIDIDKKIAENKAKLEKIKQKYSLETAELTIQDLEAIEMAELQLKLVRQQNMSDLIAATKVFMTEGSALQKMAFIAMKASAISEVIIRAQIEKAATTARMSFIPGGKAVALIQNQMTNARMATSIALIAAQTVQEIGGFAGGGYTGPGQGTPDKSGFKVAGVVHENEYVVPAWMLRKPEYANVVDWLESQRSGHSYDGFSEGGMTRRDRRRARNNTESGTKINQKNSWRAEIESFERGKATDAEIIGLLQESRDILKKIEDNTANGVNIGDDEIWKMRERQDKLVKSQENAKFR
ncbi:MAG: phage tail tape measure protein [Sphingobacteriaceae bacterium]|nr:phage tail tape measure protein [Sphingobacteriaceae bacterium]